MATEPDTSWVNTILVAQLVAQGGIDAGGGIVGVSGLATIDVAPIAAALVAYTAPS